MSNEIKILREDRLIASVPDNENTKITNFPNDKITLSFQHPRMIDLKLYDEFRIHGKKYYPLAWPEINYVASVYYFSVQLSAVQAHRKGTFNH